MEKEEVKKLIAQLYDDPVDNLGATDQVLAQLYNYLLAIPKDKSGKLHWFCRLADPTTVDVASFLLRLFAYDGVEAETWRGHLHTCLAACSDCVVEFETVKRTSRTTYFAKFSPEILDGFWASYDIWDINRILEELGQLGITPAEPDSVLQTLSDVPSAIVLRIMSNWPVFSDVQLQTIIHSIPPQTVFRDWPTTTIPPGILVLLVNQAQPLRHWANAQASRYPPSPLPAKMMTAGYVHALETVTRGIMSQDPSDAALPSYCFVTDIFDLWVGFGRALRFIPAPFLRRNGRCKVDIRKVVAGHLSDDEAHFVEVLRCFNFLLKRLESSFWADESSEYPLVVFDAIKNNPSFGRLIQGAQDKKTLGEKPWYLAWVHEYLHCIQKMDQTYSTAVAKISDFLLEELQHERFGNARSHILESAARLFSSILSKGRMQLESYPMTALLSVIEIHTSVLTRVAFHRDYDKPQWAKPRAGFRQFLHDILLLDIQQTSVVITEVCRLIAHTTLKKTPVRVPRLLFCTGLWSKIYPSIHRQDPDGLSVVIQLASEASHIDILNKKTFEKITLVDNIGEAYENGGAVITMVNKSLSLMRTGFRDGVINIIDYSTSSQLSDFLRHPKVGKAAMLLLLSPVEDLHTTAKTLIGQAFDVDGRLECVRALLENLPDSALDGLVDFLNKFCVFAPGVPEACSLSKSLVRCFTDVIDALCSKSDGLLHKSQFLRCSDCHGPASRMVELWTLMSKAIAVIFKRTPAWSTFFDNTEMVEWMRDALIFGRDMLAQWQVIMGAANAFHQYQRERSQEKADGSFKSLSGIGQNMISCFQDVLTELTRWLRLTDEELLHQSFSLLQSLLDLFRKTEIRPCDAALQKLTRYVDSARKDIGQTRSRLDTQRLSSLEEALSLFADEDDEIQIISEKIVSRPAPVKREKGIDRATLGHRQLLKGEKDTGPHISSRAKAKPTTSAFSVDKNKERLEKLAPAVASLHRQDTTGISTTTKKYILPSKPGPKEHYKNETTSSVGPDSSSGSDESESGSEIPAGGLANLARKFIKSPKIKKPAERRQIKMFGLPVGQNPGITRIQQREESHRARMRMRPDVSGLHRVVLSWNYDHDGPIPPAFNHPLKFVPDTFENPHQFYSVFEPLLLLECWAQIVQAKAEVAELYECKLSGKQYVDDWLELEVVFEANVRKEYYLLETDVVLLRQLQTNKSIMAKAKGFVSNYQATQASLRCYIRSGAEDPGLHIGSTWKISKAFSLSTIHREYAALKSLPYYDHAETILRAQLRRAAPPEQREISKTMSEYRVNEPQAIAILSGMKTEGFTLIQGPPGTGKTSTICGLISLALTKRTRSAVPIQVGNTAPSIQSPLPKILLCAPSNAAIDEIARRIKDGYSGPERCDDLVKVVRIGAEQSMNASIKNISLDYLVDQKIDAPKDAGAGGEIARVRKELEEIRARKDHLYKELDESADPRRLALIQSEIAQLNTRRTPLTGQMDRLKDEQKSASRTRDALRRSTQQKILLEADVICSTLSGAGHDIIERLDFDMVIIDEAAQAIELSTLIPLKYRCQRCILVGDPQQLPPTVLSQEAAKYRYNQSLFVRMQKAQPDAVHLLSIQYRMHPDISQLPSVVFYQGRLKDGPKLDERTVQSWHKNPRFGTYKFFNVSKGLEESSGHSIKNFAECSVAVALYNRLSLEYANINLDFRVGVVSMYRAQITELKRQFEHRFGKDILNRVDFNTVDGFQGQEKDVIILSCVRAGPGVQNVGFLSDTRRMNVALTRAKSSLFILGNSATLERSDHNWGTIVNDARKRSLLIDVDHTYFTKSLPIPENKTTTSKVTTNSTEVALAPPMPNDLFQPKDFKQNRNVTYTRPSTSDTPASNLDNSDSVSQVIGTKRPVEASTSHDGQRPPLPPVKRSKKAPTLFIPKGKRL